MDVIQKSSTLQAYQANTVSAEEDTKKRCLFVGESLLSSAKAVQHVAKGAIAGVSFGIAYMRESNTDMASSLFQIRAQQIGATKEYKDALAFAAAVRNPIAGLQRAVDNSAEATVNNLANNAVWVKERVFGVNLEQYYGA